MTDFEQFHLEPPKPNIEQPLSLEQDGTFKRGAFPLYKFGIKDNFSTDEKETWLKRGQKFNRTIFNTLVSGSVYSSSANDYLIGITSLSYAPNVGLPRPKLVGAGKTYIVKDEAGGAGTTTITVRSAAEETIDGAATSTLTTNYQSKSFYTDGANWFVY
jgi:hypothetical protein